MATQYQVVGACATDIPVGTSQGVVRVTLYRGAVLPQDVPAERLKHLLDVGLIEKVGSGDEPVAPAGVPKSEPENPTEDKPLNGRSSKADLVDHAVNQGMTREDAEAMSRDELLDKYVRKGE